VTALAQSYEYCQEVTERSKTSFALAIRLLPKEKRRALYAIYAYCRLADDVADDGADPACLRDPRLRGAMEDAIERFSIPRKYFDEILVGTKMDLEKTRYETFEELQSYCYHVAGAVGLACLHVFGYEGQEALRHAEDLGTAMQLTNIIRDVKEDAGRDRIYFPREDWRRFGVEEREILAGRLTSGLKSLLEFEVSRARAWFEKGERLLAHVDEKARKCPAAIATVYKALLDRIEARGYDVFSKRVGLTTAQKLKVLATALR
jgi:phytoene synthase